jgi:hypothetical protein
LRRFDEIRLCIPSSDPPSHHPTLSLLRCLQTPRLLFSLPSCSGVALRLLRYDRDQ